MDAVYTFEPTHVEIVLTELIGNWILSNYYRDFVNSLGLEKQDQVLDYCCGSGIISKRMVKRLSKGHLVYTDVSKKWLAHATKKIKASPATPMPLLTFDGLMGNGLYDKIIIHFALHDFPKVYHPAIVQQLIENLKQDGLLIIREPISQPHGIPLYELFNLLESTKKLSYEYTIMKKPLMGEFVDIRCQIQK